LQVARRSGRWPRTSSSLVGPKEYADVEIRFQGAKGVLSLTLEADTDD
jgi:hypothetical protein